MKKNEEKRADKEEEKKKERINRKRDNPLPFWGNPGAPLIIIMIIIIVIISWLSGGMIVIIQFPPRCWVVDWNHEEVIWLIEKDGNKVERERAPSDDYDYDSNCDYDYDYDHCDSEYDSGIYSNHDDVINVRGRTNEHFSLFFFPSFLGAFCFDVVSSSSFSSSSSSSVSVHISFPLFSSLSLGCVFFESEEKPENTWLHVRLLLPFPSSFLLLSPSPPW